MSCLFVERSMEIERHPSPPPFDTKGMIVSLTDTNGMDGSHIVLCASPTLPRPTPTSKLPAARLVLRHVRKRVQKDTQRHCPRCSGEGCWAGPPFGLTHVGNRKQIGIPEWLVRWSCRLARDNDRRMDDAP